MKKMLFLFALTTCLLLNTAQANSVDYTWANQTKVTFKVSPFCISIAKGDLETVKKLIDRGIDINQKSNGMTPLMYAARFNRADIAKLLIAKGAKLKTKSDKGKTAYQYAKLFKAKDVMAILETALSKNN